MVVHFICRGNALRSVIAESYLNSLQLQDVTAISSGTVAEKNRENNAPILKSSGELLSRHQLGNYTKKRSEQLTQGRVDAANINICMNPLVRDEAAGIVSLPVSTVTWNIIDVGEGARTLLPGDMHSKYDEDIFKDITAEVDRLVRELT